MPFCREQKVYRSTLLINGAIQIGPAAFHLYIWLVAAPRSAHCPTVPVPALLKSRNVSLHPSQNGGVRQFNTALTHHFNQVACTQFVTEVPPDTQNDDFLVKLPPFEQVLVRCHSMPLCQRCPGHADFAPEPSFTLR